MRRYLVLLVLVVGGCDEGARHVGVQPAGTDNTRAPRPMALQPGLPRDLGATLVFHSNRDGRHKLFTIDLPGGRIRRLTEGREHHDESPSSSPDGTRIAFVTTRFDFRTWDIAVLNRTSGAVDRLTTDLAFDRHPSWSPDGQSVVFSSERDGTQAVFRAALATRAIARLSPPPDRGLMPAMSPDGRRIAYTMGTREGLRIVVQDLVSGERRAVTAEGADSAEPRWSPDGARLAYTRLRPGGSSFIDVLTLENGAIQSLAIEAFDGLREPAWSPDGRWLAAAASASIGDDENWDLVIFDTDPGVAAFGVTMGAANDRSPSWLPR